VNNRRSIVLTDPQKFFLQAEAERLGISVADLIRRIIDEHRAAKETPARRRVASE